ncbi:MAG: PTS sugar transporter subunit IIA [Lachnospiraceae bacterium]
MVSMLEESHVQIHVHADDWEDAIRKAGNVLVTAGSIDTSYIEHMIQSVKTLGPYIVIMPGFALAHASPCEAVKKSDIALITLDHPIDFGSENGPVSVILCLACTDSSSHLDRLSQIAELLMQEHKIEQIASAQTPDDVVRLFQTA